MPWRRRARTARLTFAGSPVENFPGDFQVSGFARRRTALTRRAHSGLVLPSSSAPRSRPWRSAMEDRMVTPFTVQFFALLVHALVVPSSENYERCDEAHKERALDPEQRQCAWSVTEQTLASVRSCRGRHQRGNGTVQGFENAFTCLRRYALALLGVLQQAVRPSAQA